jgi:hypothetical protein
MNGDITTYTVTRKERRVETPVPASELEEALQMMRRNMEAQPEAHGELLAEIRDGFIVLSYEMGRT